MLTISNDRRQRDDDAHCGAVSVATCLDLAGIPADQSTVLVASGLPVSMAFGVHPATIEAFLFARGLCVQSGSMDFSDLRHHTARDRPVLCLTSEHGGHWVTVIGTAGHNVWFHDPAAGVRWKRKREWLAGWWDRDKFGTMFQNYGIAAWR